MDNNQFQKGIKYIYWKQKAVIVFCFISFLLGAIFFQSRPGTLLIILLIIWYYNIRKREKLLKSIDVCSIENEPYVQKNIQKLGRYLKITKANHAKWNEDQIIKYAINFLKKEDPDYWKNIFKNEMHGEILLNKYINCCIITFKRYPESDNEKIITHCKKIINNS